MIRRTAAKNVVDTSGPGGPELCDGAPRAKEPAAQRTPDSWLERQRKPGAVGVVPTGGQVEPSVQLKAVPIGCNAAVNPNRA